MIDKKLSTQDSMQKWHSFLTAVFQELMSVKKKIKVNSNG
jgi:hypothetical protein